MVGWDPRVCGKVGPTGVWWVALMEAWWGKIQSACSEAGPLGSCPSNR